MNKQIEEFDDEGEDKLWNFRQIIGHSGPLHYNDPGYKGSRYNLEIEWETGEITHEPSKIIIESDPYSVAQYAKENGLLDKPGFKRLRRFLKRAKKIIREINATIHSQGSKDRMKQNKKKPLKLRAKP